MKAPAYRSYVSPTGDFSLVYDQQLRWVSWDGTRGYPTTNTTAGSGHQFYSPFSLQLIGRRNSDWTYEILARGGAVDSRQTTAGQSGSYSGFIDTLFSGSITYTGNARFQPFVSLAMNAPTGETKLFGNARFARMDPDLVFVPTFGEGFNVGPTAGVVVPLGPDTRITLAAGYTNRGSYTREDGGSGTLPVNVSPSDETSLTAEFRQRLNPYFVYWTGITYAWQSTTTLDVAGIRLKVEPGDRLTVRTGARYSWAPLWHTTARFNYTHLGTTVASDNFSGVLTSPGVNPNNDTYYVSLEQLYGLGNYGVGVRGSYFRRDGNEYVAALANFVPGKERYQLAGFVSLPATQRLSLNAELSRIWTTEDAAPGLGVPEIHNDAWTAILGARYAILP